MGTNCIATLMINSLGKFSLGWFSLTKKVSFVASRNIFTPLKKSNENEVKIIAGILLAAKRVNKSVVVIVVASVNFCLIKISL